MLAKGRRRASFRATGSDSELTLRVMRLSGAGLLCAALGLAAACGGRSREPETGQTGAAGSAGGTAGADACERGRASYRRQQSELVATTNSCEQDSDCGTLWEANACVSTCGTPIQKSIIDSLSEQLRELAALNCSSCPPIPTPPCVPPGPLQCIEKRCREAW